MVARPGISTPAPHLVPRPPLRNPAPVPPRPPFGQNGVVRPRTTDRARPPSPPTLEGPRPPERAFEGAPPVTPQAPPQLRHGPPVASPPPGAPQPLARRPETPPLLANHAQPPAPPRREGPSPSHQSSGGGLSTTRQAPAPSPGGPQVADLPPAMPQPPARRAEAPHLPTRPLLGEPAKQLPPNRTKARPPQHAEHQVPPSPVRPKSAPSNAPRERPGA